MATKRKGSIYKPDTFTYHRTTNDRIIKQQRNHTLSSILPIGLGVLYTWEWNFLYFDSEKEEKTKGSQDWMHFVYAGITAQVTPRDRFMEHFTSPERVKSDPKVKNKNLYVALNDAIYNTKEPGTYGKRTISKSDLEGGVFKVMDVVSLFDLGLAETGVVDKYNLKNTTSATGIDIKSIYENAQGRSKKIVGLNQEVGGGAGGEGEPVRQARAPLEWLYAAYYSATEDTGKEHISAGRSSYRYKNAFNGSNVKQRMINILFVHSENEAAVRQSFSNTAANISEKKDYEVAVELFLTYLGANTNREGFELDENNNIIVASKFNKINGTNRGAEIDAFIIGEAGGSKGDLRSVEGRTIALNEIMRQIKSKPEKISFDIMTAVADSLDAQDLKDIENELKKSKIPEEISYEWISNQILKGTGQKIVFSQKMTQYKSVTQDTLKRIYLILKKVSDKRAAAGVDAMQSARIGNKINLYSKALGLGQFTKK
jgi:hypothetical protein